MTKIEVKNLLGIIKTAYPALQKKDIEEKRKMLNLWCGSLKDISTEKAMDNMNNHIKTSPFIPTIADIINSKNTKYCNYEQREYSKGFIESFYDNEKI